ncbi:MAG: GDSL-type esterase/lipase family protein [Oscillospiraceae bacterium]|nr:GDSL-type esterase/lipase family protein [Oscillospiraceae bacterium]
MASYKEFRQQAKRRQRRRAVRRVAAVAVILLMLAALAYLAVKIIAVLDKREDENLPDSAVSSQGVSESEGQEDEEETRKNIYIPAQIGTTPKLMTEQVIQAPNAKMLALPENIHGPVDVSYFANAVFVGDSLTEGVEIYSKAKYPETTQYLWMRGINPMTFINGLWNATAPNPNLDKGQQYYTRPIDDVYDSHPGKIYLMLGTNGIAAGLSDETILKYYGQVLDAIKERCPGTLIYVQSITPVGISLEEKYPAQRIRQLNDQIAAMAVERGCFYLDLHEVLADETDHMNPAWGSPDGWHMAKNPDGYAQWFDYLLTHTVHQQGNPYVADPTVPIQEPVQEPQPEEPVI